MASSYKQQTSEILIQSRFRDPHLDNLASWVSFQAETERFLLDSSDDQTLSGSARTSILMVEILLDKTDIEMMMLVAFLNSLLNEEIENGISSGPKRPLIFTDNGSILLPGDKLPDKALEGAARIYILINLEVRDGALAGRTPLQDQILQWLGNDRRENGDQGKRVKKNAEITLRQLFSSTDAIRLQLLPPVAPMLTHSLPDIQADRDSLPVDRPIVDGSGVIVADVDFGCDFRHPNLRYPDGGTRLLYIWNENPRPSFRALRPPSAIVQFGFEFDSDAIDGALQDHLAPDFGRPEDRPYHSLGYHYIDDYYQDSIGDGAHGTHVIDVAAGSGLASDTVQGGPGVAPGADLIFVQVHRPVEIAGRADLNSGYVFWGIAYVFRRADQLDRKAVVNLSLNGIGGPHDGKTPLDRALDALLARQGRALTVAAGNFRTSRTHARGEVRSGRFPRRLTWQFPDQDVTRNDLEIFYTAEEEDTCLLAVLVTPRGERHVVKPGETKAILRDGRLIGIIHNVPRHPYEIDPEIAKRTGFILVSLRPTRDDVMDDSRASDWQVELRVVDRAGDPKNVNHDVPFNAWIERDDRGQSTFTAAEADTELTLGSFSCAERPIVVGGYAQLLRGRPFLPYSSAGPTRSNDLKPEVSAPARDVFAARSGGGQPRYPGTGMPWRTGAVTPKQGTSIAAPHVAGLVALLYQQHPDATLDQIRKAVIQSAVPVSRSGMWHPVLGHGRVSAAGALRALDDIINP